MNRLSASGAQSRRLIFLSDKLPAQASGPFAVGHAQNRCVVVASQGLDNATTRLIFTISDGFKLYLNYRATYLPPAYSHPTFIQLGQKSAADMYFSATSAFCLLTIH